MLLASINAILCLVISCPLDISVASCLALSLSSAFEPSHVPYIIDSDGIVSATSNIQNVITSGFLSVSHIRKLYNIIHNAIEINLNIQRYWLPGSIFNTGYSAVVVHNSIIIPVIKPVLDFLYPKYSIDGKKRCRKSEIEIRIITFNSLKWIKRYNYALEELRHIL